MKHTSNTQNGIEIHKRSARKLAKRRIRERRVKIVQQKVHIMPARGPSWSLARPYRLGSLAPIFALVAGAACVAPGDTVAQDSNRLTTAPASCVPKESGLLAHYRLDGQDNERTQLQIHGATAIKGRLGSAYEFDGGDYIALRQIVFDEIGALPTMTACAWFRTGQEKFDNFSLFDFDRSEYFSLYIEAKTGRVAFGTAAYIPEENRSQVHDLVGSNFVADGEWHHACVAYDGRDKFIYLDGKLDRKSLPLPHDGRPLGTGKTRYGFIGDGSEATTFDGHRNNLYFEGAIDNVRLYTSFLESPQEASHRRLFVKPPQPPPYEVSSGDGSSWDTAFRSLQEAVDSATHGDRIWVQKGTYTAAEAGQPVIRLPNVDSQIVLFGGFVGTETRLDQRPGFQANSPPSVFLDGGGKSPQVVTADDIERVSMEGFTIRGATQSGMRVTRTKNDAGALSLRHVWFLDNHGMNGGAMDILSDSDVVLEDVVFIGNSASENGGAIRSYARNLLMSARFEDNEARFGGALANHGRATLFRSNFFVNNRALEGGGALYIAEDSGDVGIADAVFERNSAQKNGGAIMNLRETAPTYDDTQEWRNVDFVRNRVTVYGAGGAVFNAGLAKTKIVDATFVGNEAITFGGAMYNKKSSAEIVESVFEDNSSQQGGAIYNRGGHQKFERLRFARNTAWGLGSAIFNLDASPTLVGARFEENRTVQGQQDGFGGSISNMGDSFPRLSDVIFDDNIAFECGMPSSD